MADQALASYASLLYDMRGPLQSRYPTDHVLLAEFSGVGDDGSSGRLTPLEKRENFTGKLVRFPIDLAQLQGGGFVSETGTINVPIADAYTHATMNLVDVVVPASITLDLSEDSISNSAAEALAMKVTKTRKALAEIVNDAMNGNGDGKLAAADTTQASAGGLVLKVAAATTDFDKLYPGKVVDVLTATTGADPGAGLRRKINSFDDSLTVPTVTFSTTQQASDGGSGNITLSNLVGVYITGSYGNTMQGIEQAGSSATTGTFQAIDRANFPTWRGTDGRNTVTTVSPLSDSMLDAGTLRGQRAGTSDWDFGLGDPAAINVYKNGKQSQVRYTPDVSKLKSGFEGIIYNGTGKPIPLVPERKSTLATVRLIRKDAAALYGRSKGPEFDNVTGAMFQRFSRSLPFEFWLVDRLNWAWMNPASIVSFANLSVS